MWQERKKQLKPLLKILKLRKVKVAVMATLIKMSLTPHISFYGAIPLSFYSLISAGSTRRRAPQWDVALFHLGWNTQTGGIHIWDTSVTCKQRFCFEVYKICISTNIRKWQLLLGTLTEYLACIFLLLLLLKYVIKGGAESGHKKLQSAANGDTRTLLICVCWWW